MRYILLLLLCSVAVLNTACTTLADARKAKGTGTSRIYAVPDQSVWKALPGVVQKVGLEYVSGNPQEGLALAQNSMSALSYGENVAIFVDPLEQNQKTRVEVVSKRQFAPNVLAVNWEDRVLDGLTAVLPQSTAASADASSVQTPAEPLTHTDAVPPASGFANINDVTALPLTNAKEREHYSAYLAAAAPKAFVISQQGKGRWVANDPKAMRKALSQCLSMAGAHCWLYAVDNTVVWQGNENQRVSLEQLVQKMASPEGRVEHSGDGPVDNTHADAVPAASGYARIDEVDALPFLNEKGRSRYKAYLSALSPKAFVVDDNGGWNWIAKDPQAMRKALLLCLARSSGQCWLYAVDDKVVWQADERKRTSLEKLGRAR